MQPVVWPTPKIDSTDLSPYRQAMRPEFATDVDAVAEAGASRYFINVTVDLQDNNPRLFGVERVLYTNTETEPLSEIYFRLYPNMVGYGGNMQISAALVDDEIVTPQPEAENSAVRIPLPASLPPGAQADVSLFFEVDIPTHNSAGYNIFSFTNNTAALAGFYPTVAVYDEGGWDLTVPPPYGDATYLDVSLYQVTATVPEEMVVAATGNQLGVIANADGTKTVQLASGPMRDFYIAMRPDYRVVSDTVDGIIINSYYPAGLDKGGQMALQYAIDSLRVFNEAFGAYPYAEFDVAATPTTAGGVEYPGIVVAAETLYTSEGGFFQHVIGHEVAHQWWYGLVGNHQILEPWLDEALTNYSTAIYWEATEGQNSANHIVDTFFAGPYERVKRSGNDRTILGDVGSFTQGEYVDIVYSKGPLFFHALRREVGDDVYFGIMQTYFAKNKYKLATADDLIAVIKEFAGQTTNPLIETWLETP